MARPGNNGAAAAAGATADLQARVHDAGPLIWLGMRSRFPPVPIDAYDDDDICPEHVGLMGVDGTGNTALHWACAGGHASMVERLEERKESCVSSS